MLIFFVQDLATTVMEKDQREEENQKKHHFCLLFLLSEVRTKESHTLLCFTFHSQYFLQLQHPLCVSGNRISLGSPGYAKHKVGSKTSSILLPFYKDNCLFSLGSQVIPNLLLSCSNNNLITLISQILGNHEIKLQKARNWKAFVSVWSFIFFPCYCLQKH